MLKLVSHMTLLYVFLVSHREWNVETCESYDLVVACLSCESSRVEC